MRERRLRRICAGAAELQWLAALPAVPGPIRPTGDKDLVGAFRCGMDWDRL